MIQYIQKTRSRLCFFAVISIIAGIGISIVCNESSRTVVVVQVHPDATDAFEAMLISKHDWLDGAKVSKHGGLLWQIGITHAEKPRDLQAERVITGLREWEKLYLDSVGKTYHVLVFHEGARNIAPINNYSWFADEDVKDSLNQLKSGE